MKRSLHACVAFETNIYVFGGYDGINRKNDFYRYSVETNTWTQLSSGAAPQQQPSLIAGAVAQGDSNLPSPRDRHVAGKNC
jgi:N-acetylneuraminic acid mutarotase